MAEGGAEGRSDGRAIDSRIRSELRPVRRALVASAVVGTAASACVIAQVLALSALISWAAEGAGALPRWALVLLLAALAARSALAYLAERLASRSASATTAELRRRLLVAVVADGAAGADQRRSGAILLAATRGLRSLDAYVGRYIPAAITAATAPVLAIVALGIVDWPSALIALGLAALVPPLMILLGRRAAAAATREWSRLSSLSTRALELLRGLPTLRALGRVDAGRGEMVAASEAVATSIESTLAASLSSGAALELLAGVGVGLVAMLAGLRLLWGSLPMATAFAAILVTPEVFLPLRRAGAEFHASTDGRAAAGAIFDLLDELEAGEPPAPGTVVLDSPLPLVAEGLTLRYRAAQRPAIADLRLELSEGSKIVVTGRSGSGKSTLVGLLSGALRPTEGSLRVGATPLSELDPSWWRSQVAVVPQDPHVFSASVRDNLFLGQEPDEAAGIAALAAVGLERLAEREGGLSAHLGERGTGLSAGERQRLGLARALLLDRPILLLDEATSHLDAETVAELRRSLGPWLDARSCLEVGHGPSLLSGDLLELGLEDGVLG